ncbi:MerR family transcriptional regulator [Pseudoalteromonas rubra]|uniref:MerR family transcriptional regulator n=1 Tax=Pseudoalteromonas rubra TaxID=43658 RepID=A0A0U3I5E9_9GAMM|nr:MerR family transcriptional regulator [Pseudoalteromonas rubra]ALU45238.1 MerR family transcriptional regulator [Pseudoalteromonas rubra]
MKIGELSKQTGISIRMLRYYEEQGLLHPSRSPSGYRHYTPSDIQTLTRIQLLSAAGMTLNTILQFLPCIRGDRPIFEPCDELRNLLHSEIKAVDEKAARLAESKAILSRFLEEIEQG